MSDGVLAAIIAASATIFTAFLQLRAALAREMAARGAPVGNRRKNNGTPMLFLSVMLGGAAVGGFALSQWLMERERSIQNALMQEMQARVATLTRSESQLQQMRNDARAEIEASVLRRIGLEGVAVSATVGPCRPPLVLNTPAVTATTAASAPQVPSPVGTGGSPATACTESDATQVTLCATLPVTAAVTQIELFMRPAASTDTPWANGRMTPGLETNQSRFSERPVEVSDGNGFKEVCHTFASWNTERAHAARMLVRYSL